MTPKKRAQLAADRRSAAAISNRCWTSAEAAGVVPKSGFGRDHIELPDTLEPLLAIRERRLMHKAMKYFEAAFRSGWDVYHLTWCPPEFRVPPGSLTPDVVKQLRTIASRRARNIPTTLGRRLIGGVDIAFNPDGTQADWGVWCVHLHALVIVRDLDGVSAQNAIKSAFRVDPRDREVLDIRPRKAVKIKDLAHLLKTMSYISGVLALVDHNPRQNRHRRYREVRQATSYKSYQMLPGHLQQELTRLYAALGPKGFWVLSGFRRRGDRVEPEPGFTQAETDVLKDLRGQRKSARKVHGGFGMAVNDLRLF
ncbi:hypothetical protein KB221_07510 [Aquidulcibacter paucihalophilus]|nr:hypothetical protein KB221_07510 [Aquidulcibacter paucihalophilus]